MLQSISSSHAGVTATKSYPYISKNARLSLSRSITVENEKSVLDTPEYKQTLLLPVPLRNHDAAVSSSNNGMRMGGSFCMEPIDNDDLIAFYTCNYSSETSNTGRSKLNGKERRVDSGYEKRIDNDRDRNDIEDMEQERFCEFLGE